MPNIIDKIQLSGITYDIGGQGGSGVSVVEVTQAEYDALPSSAKTDTSKMYVITDAEAGDLTNYYTKTETNTLLGGKADTATTYTKTEVDNAITAATATKQDTLVSGTNIKTINNESILGSGNIDIQGGGGKAIEAGRGISVTTGATADTVSFDLPISADTNGSILIGVGCSANRDKSFIGGQTSVGQGEGSFAFGQNCKAGQWSIAVGNNVEANVTQNSVAFGKFNKQNGGFYEADSATTLFSVGNGNGGGNERHNAFEIRRNGDIYISSGGTDIKLQDHLGGGGSITVDSTLDSGSTNPVENQALYDELRIENAPVETTLTFTQPVGDSYYWTTNYPSGCTTLVGNILASSTQIELYNNSSDLGGFIINCYDGVLDSVYFLGIEGTYSISGSVVTISYPNVTNVTRFRIREAEYRPDYQTYKAMATVAPTVLKNQVNDNTTALGGLKLQQISQSDYENLPTKDSSTLYIII